MKVFEGNEKEWNFFGNKTKGRISKPVFQKKKQLAKSSEKRTFLTPWYAQVRGEGGSVRFSENLLRFVFLRFALALG